MKTPDALSKALEAVSDVHEAMIEDIDDSDTTTPEATGWVNRLKALGNGQVPLCTAIAWEVLNDRI